MLTHWLGLLQQQGVSIESVLQLGKWALIACAVGGLLLWRLLPPRQIPDDEEGFRLREHERKSGGRPRLDRPPPEGTRPRQPAAPLSLEGIRLDVPPHALLGIAAEATPEEIQRAHRELMKRYHPDRVGRPDSREWRDAQAIAEALNRARGVMLEAAKQRAASTRGR